MIEIIAPLLFLPTLVTGKALICQNGHDDQCTDFWINIITSNLKKNGWNNIIMYGHFPDDLYVKLNHNIALTFVTSNKNEDNKCIDDVVAYPANAVLMSSENFENFETSFLQIMKLPYWHPHANIFLFYGGIQSNEDIARIFFIFWYYKAFNVILIQNDDTKMMSLISHYNPYISKNYHLDYEYGCWTVKKLGLSISNFSESFTCEKSCLNISSLPKLRKNHLGTCIGFTTSKIFNNYTNPEELILFEDKTRNLNGFKFKAYVVEILPFMSITELPNNTYVLSSREGSVWNTMSDVMNFTIDFSPSINAIKKDFNFELGIQQIFSMAQRRGADLFLLPIYLFDVIVVDIDNTFPFRESGVCFISHRADFTTVLFDLKDPHAYYFIYTQFAISFICIWVIFCLYSAVETDKLTMDGIGKSFMNSVRSILQVNLLHPPKRTSFRLFLLIIIWSYFIINFSIQATIISFLSALKRGPDVDTFYDIAEKGYRIEGMASPDVLLPDTDEVFRKINSRLAPIPNIFSCVKAMINDSQRFCLIDCSTGQYLIRNMLDKKGEQYLHIAKDRVHSHYLNFIFPKHSPLTNNFNKFIMRIFEAGLIKKWEQYRYNNIKEEIPVKSLGLDDAKRIIELAWALMALNTILFLLEVVIGKCCKNKSK